jgi:YidC/Oxa1 family membrane protein insertase
MDRRTIIAIALIMAVLIGDQIFMSWWARRHQPPKPTTADSTGVVATGGAPAGGGILPQGGSPAGVLTPSPAAPPAGVSATGGPAGAAPTAPGAGPRVPHAPLVERGLKTALFDATFSSLGGTITRWALPKYPDLTRAKAPVDLVSEGRRTLRLWVSTPYFNYDFTDVPFRVETPAAFDSSVTFVAEDSSGVRIRKSYRVAADSRAVDLEIRITVPPEFGPIQFRYGWGNALPVTEKVVHPHDIRAVALVGDKQEEIDGLKIQKEGTKALKGNVRWVANRSKYFAAAVIPDSASAEDVVFAQAEGGGAAVFIAGAAAPGTEIVRRARLYAGPIHYDTLVEQGAELDRLANLGWRWVTGLSAFLLACLNFIHRHIPNYGIAIILISAATKLVFYPLTQTSLRSMKLMHHLQPEVKAIQERYKKDPAKMNAAMMELYKQNKVNPLSGCLPTLLQVPVFIALYNVLLNSIELRGAGFVGYVQDLATPDVLLRIAGFPIHLFPIVMTGSTYLMQAQTPVAPQQKSMMMLMPVMMLVFMYSFPSGVVLYWIVNNVLSALQQYLVNAAEDRKMAAGA